MFSQKAMCGSVGASRAGNPEVGGSSWGQSLFVGGLCKIGQRELNCLVLSELGYVRLWIRD